MQIKKNLDGFQEQSKKERVKRKEIKNNLDGFQEQSEKERGQDWN